MVAGRLDGTGWAGADGVTRLRAALARRAAASAQPLVDARPDASVQVAFAVDAGDEEQALREGERLLREALAEAGIAGNALLAVEPWGGIGAG
jgi:hypothetical protein